MLREIMPSLNAVLRMRAAESRQSDKPAMRRALRGEHQEHSPAELLHA
jgi:hypothetical protein